MGDNKYYGLLSNLYTFTNAITYMCFPLRIRHLALNAIY